MVERLSIQIGSEEMTFETGRIAKQAQGSVLITQGETVVLTAACVSPEARPGQSFFPLTVEYREKSAAAGRVPGNFFRREGRPSEREILVCRMTDRPIRPLFPKGFMNEVQVFSTVYSTDNDNNPDILSMNGASAALHLSKIPFAGPIGAVRVGMIDGELAVNPGFVAMEESELDIVMAGTKEAIMMVEGGADEIPEDVLVEALEFGHGYIKEICDAIEELRSRVGDEKMPFEEPETDPDVVEHVTELAETRYEDALAVQGKKEREAAIDAIEADVEVALLERYGEEQFEERRGDIQDALSAIEKRLMRGQIINENKRVDGRGLTDVRDISVEVGVLPRSHGSCLFTRGETQALVSTTLGTSRDEQRLDELTGESFKRFMLHYNFPPFSVGETRRITGPGRREIGHGNLAERALTGQLPLSEDEEGAFPYTVRVLSDITESNGSSSMATVCGGAMSLMDAGVPMKAPVAGIAMGLVKEDDEIRVLTDILGSEDHLGDMDFKVCGTRDGVTSFQMDIKIGGITSEIMSRALDQARDARMFVLDRMLEALDKPRTEISQYAPRIHTMQIPVDKIRDVIGPGGKVIRGIQAETGAEIEIEDDGTVKVAAIDGPSAEAAMQQIKMLTAEPEVGEVYHGTVVRLMNFGAFVSIPGGKDGLVHISELAPGRVNEVGDVVTIGDEIPVKVIEIDDLNRINLSKVQADLELGNITQEEYEAAKSQGGGGRGDGGGRGGGDHKGGRGGDRKGGRGGDRRGGGGDRKGGGGGRSRNR